MWRMRYVDIEHWISLKIKGESNPSFKLLYCINDRNGKVHFNALRWQRFELGGNQHSCDNVLVGFSRVGTSEMETGMGTGIKTGMKTAMETGMQTGMETGMWTQ